MFFEYNCYNFKIVGYKTEQLIGSFLLRLLFTRLSIFQLLRLLKRVELLFL